MIDRILLGRLAGGAVMLAVAAGSAQAASGQRLAWSTYLRSGPAQTYPAIDELEHDTAVKVLDCSTRWCRVDADGLQGFVDRDALTLSRTPDPRSFGVDACVITGQADAQAPKATRFCAPTRDLAAKR